jgi:hypothetical protein
MRGQRFWSELLRAAEDVFSSPRLHRSIRVYDKDPASRLPEGVAIAAEIARKVIERGSSLRQPSVQD